MADRSFLQLNIRSVEGGLSLPCDKGEICGNESFADSDCPLVVTPKGKKKYCGKWTSAACLTISLIVSYIVWHTDVFFNAVSHHLVLRNGTRLFEVWEKEPVTTTLSIYLFNYTNKEAFEDGVDEKLRVEEIGPFAYTVYTTRENITFNPNGTVSYQERRTLYFAPELSNGSLDDELVLPSLPYLSTLDKMKDSYFFTRNVVSRALDQFGVQLFVKVAARDFIWGYQDQLFSMAYKASKFQEHSLPYDKIGLLVGKNETQKEIITIFTGEHDIKKKGFASRIDGEKSLHHWSGSECNRLDGLTTMLMPPFQTTKTHYIYTKDACRRVPFNFKRTEFSRGLYSSRFELPESFLNFSGANRCYCSDTCLPDGVLNVSACAFGAPILASKPHYLHGDPVLLTYVDGLKPDEKLHNSHVNVQTDLGFILDGTTSAQMNVMLRNLYGGTLKSVYKDQMILPISWLKMSLDDFPPSIQWEVNAMVAFYITFEMTVFYVPLMVAVGSLIAIIIRQIRRIRIEQAAKSMNNMKNMEVADL